MISRHATLKMLLAVMAIVAAAGSAWAGEGEKPQPNPQLRNLPAQELKVLIPAGGYKGDPKVLDFSGMAYDPNRQKIVAFGGGHATASFPNSVHEFDLNTLKWSALSEDVPPEQYSAENAVLTADGKKLGGVKQNGKIYAGSRHTYDGLVMLPGRSILLSMQAQEFIGAAGRMPPGAYEKYYIGGDGLWYFDCNKREWSVVEKTGLSNGYSFAEIDPSTPDLIYFGCAFNGSFRCLDFKTKEIKALSPRPSASTGSDMCMSFYPEKHTFYAFTSGNSDKNGRVFEYTPAKNAWQEIKTTGEAPNTYSLNVPYDETNKVFVCFSADHCYYLNPVEAKWYKLEKPYPVKRLYHHHIYDSVNNVHIMTGGGWETYAFKLADKPENLSERPAAK